MTPAANLPDILATLPDELAGAISDGADSALARHRQDIATQLAAARLRLPLPSRLVFSMATGNPDTAEGDA